MDIGRVSRGCAMLVICIIVAAIPLLSGINGVMKLHDEDIPRFESLFFPMAYQYICSFVITLVVTIATGYITQRLINRHGAINCQLSEVVDIGKKAMVTARLTFLATYCLQVWSVQAIKKKEIEKGFVCMHLGFNRLFFPLSQ